MNIDELSWNEWRGVLFLETLTRLDAEDALWRGLIVKTKTSYERTPTGRSVVEQLQNQVELLRKIQLRALQMAEGFDGDKPVGICNELQGLVTLGFLNEGIPSEWGARDYSYTPKGYAALVLLQQRKK